MVGGEDKKLLKLDKDFKLISSIDVGDVATCGITVNQQLVFGMDDSKSLRVFDTSLKLIKDIKLKD